MISIENGVMTLELGIRIRIRKELELGELGEGKIIL